KPYGASYSGIVTRFRIRRLLRPIFAPAASETCSGRSFPRASSRRTRARAKTFFFRKRSDASIHLIYTCTGSLSKRADASPHTISRDASTGAGQDLTGLTAAVQLRHSRRVWAASIEVMQWSLKPQSTEHYRGGPPI